MVTEAARGIALACALLVSVACAGPRFFPTPVFDGRLPVRPGAAAVQMYKAPLQVSALGQKLGPKVGKAKSQGFLVGSSVPGFGSLLLLAGLPLPPLLAFGDASVDAAARAGGITKVDHLDYEILSILGIYVEYTVIAYGS